MYISRNKRTYAPAASEFCPSETYLTHQILSQYYSKNSKSSSTSVATLTTTSPTTANPRRGRSAAHSTMATVGTASAMPIAPAVHPHPHPNRRASTGTVSKRPVRYQSEKHASSNAADHYQERTVRAPARAALSTTTTSTTTTSTTAAVAEAVAATTRTVQERGILTENININNTIIATTAVAEKYQNLSSKHISVEKRSADKKGSGNGSNDLIAAPSSAEAAKQEQDQEKGPMETGDLFAEEADEIALLRSFTHTGEGDSEATEMGGKRKGSGGRNSRRRTISKMSAESLLSLLTEKPPTPPPGSTHGAPAVLVRSPSSASSASAVPVFCSTAAASPAATATIASTIATTTMERSPPGSDRKRKHQGGGEDGSSSDRLSNDNDPTIGATDVVDTASASPTRGGEGSSWDLVFGSDAPSESSPGQDDPGPDRRRGTLSPASARAMLLLACSDSNDIGDGMGTSASASHSAAAGLSDCPSPPAISPAPVQMSYRDSGSSRSSCLSSHTSCSSAIETTTVASVASGDLVVGYSTTETLMLCVTEADDDCDITHQRFTRVRNPSPAILSRSPEADGEDQVVTTPRSSHFSPQRSPVIAVVNRPSPSTPPAAMDPVAAVAKPLASGATSPDIVIAATATAAAAPPTDHDDRPSCQTHDGAEMQTEKMQMEMQMEGEELCVETTHQVEAGSASAMEIDSMEAEAVASFGRELDCLLGDTGSIDGSSPAPSPLPALAQPSGRGSSRYSCAPRCASSGELVSSSSRSSSRDLLSSCNSRHRTSDGSCGLDEKEALSSLDLINGSGMSDEIFSDSASPIAAKSVPVCHTEQCTEGGCVRDIDHGFDDRFNSCSAGMSSQEIYPDVHDASELSNRSSSSSTGEVCIRDDLDAAAAADMEQDHQGVGAETETVLSGETDISSDDADVFAGPNPPQPHHHHDLDSVTCASCSASEIDVDDEAPEYSQLDLFLASTSADKSTTAVCTTDALQTETHHIASRGNNQSQEEIEEEQKQHHEPQEEEEEEEQQQEPPRGLAPSPPTCPKATSCHLRPSPRTNAILAATIISTAVPTASSSTATSPINRSNSSSSSYKSGDLHDSLAAPSSVLQLQDPSSLRQHTPSPQPGGACAVSSSSSDPEQLPCQAQSVEMTASQEGDPEEEEKEIKVDDEERVPQCSSPPALLSRVRSLLDDAPLPPFQPAAAVNATVTAAVTAANVADRIAAMNDPVFPPHASPPLQPSPKATTVALAAEVLANEIDSILNDSLNDSTISIGSGVSEGRHVFFPHTASYGTWSCKKDHYDDDSAGSIAGKKAPTSGGDGDGGRDRVSMHSASKLGVCVGHLDEDLKAFQLLESLVEQRFQEGSLSPAALRSQRQQQQHDRQLQEQQEKQREEEEHDCHHGGLESTLVVGAHASSVLDEAHVAYPANEEPLLLENDDGTGNEAGVPLICSESSSGGPMHLAGTGGSVSDIGSGGSTGGTVRGSCPSWLPTSTVDAATWEAEAQRRLQTRLDTARWQYRWEIASFHATSRAAEIMHTRYSHSGAAEGSPHKHQTADVAAASSDFGR